MRDSRFFKAADLMLRLIPSVAQETCFALKGGTAINLFVRDMPRLSVDIDLTYLPIEPREATLKNIAQALHRIAAAIKTSDRTLRVHEKRTSKNTEVFKLVVAKENIEIIIEPNTILRGTVFPTEARDLSKQAQKLFEQAVSITTLSLPDLYGGKLCAALDRQHPRDLFDIKILLENEGITSDTRKAFVVYLASHPKPIHELLDPIKKDIKEIYEREFKGMTSIPISYEELLTTRETFTKLLLTGLSDPERRFLISLKEGTPQWELLEISGIERLPSLRWKLLNIQKLQRTDKKKHEILLAKLKKILET